jgi:hypothetical protein
MATQYRQIRSLIQIEAQTYRASPLIFFFVVATFITDGAYSESLLALSAGVPPRVEK